MEKQWDFVVGIDVSKKTFDVAVGANRSDAIVHKARFDNNMKGYHKLTRWFKKEGLAFDKTLICLENTGIYHRVLARYVQAKGATVWVESAVQIKWSGGIQRGKSDEIDSKRIMDYAYRNQDKSKAYIEKGDAIQQLADYLSLRERLQNCISALKKPINELSSMGLVKEAKALKKACRKSLKSLEVELKVLDKTILSVIAADEDLKRKYDLATSVKCVGFVTASYLLVYTDGFTRFESAKQIAAYAGIAPYEYSSGTSIRGKTKVHHMANKTLKKTLHMCAVSSVRHNKELAAYYTRKLDEGKNKMLVLNAIRNKIVGRVFSCVMNQRMYTASYAA